MKKIKFCLQISILVVLILIYLFCGGLTVYYIYKNNSGFAGVFATLLGIPLTIFIALLPITLNKYKSTFLIERHLNDIHFVDRDTEYTKLANLIIHGEDKIIYITGKFGMGKTSFMKMACDRVNYTDKKKWTTYAAFYFNYARTKPIAQSISIRFCGHSNASVKEISKLLNNATLKKNSILFIDNISEMDLNDCIEFARAFIECNKNNQIIIAVDSNEERIHISPGEFREEEVKLLAQSYNTPLQDSEVFEIAELSNGYPVYARYSVEAYSKGIKVVDYYNLENYIEDLVNSLNNLEKSSLSLIICLGMLLQDAVEIKLLSGVDNRITKRTIKKLATCSLINAYKEKIYIDKLISFKCLEFLAEYKNQSYQIIYNHFKRMSECSYIALIAALKSDFEYEQNLVKEILHKQYSDGNFHLLIDIGELEFNGQINSHLREDEECWIYVRYYYLKSLLEFGLYDKAKEVVDKYDKQFNLLNIDSEIAFEYQYLLVDLDHLTNCFEDAIIFSEGLMQKTVNKLQMVKCQYLFAHCMRHVGEELERAYAIFETLINDNDYADDKIRIRSIYSAASIKMFQGDINYPYKNAFEKIDKILYADEKNTMWIPYVARHKAIYELKICQNIDKAEQLLLDTIQMLEVTPLRIKYDIYFELADLYRIKEFNPHNYKMSVDYYSKAAEFANRVNDYNLESNAQLGLILLNLKYGYQLDKKLLLTIISKTCKVGLKINYNNALYVQYLIKNESIPEELVSYWQKMKYSDLLSLLSRSKSEKCNLKLTVM